MNRRPIMRYKFTNFLTISVKQPLPYLRDKGDFDKKTHTTGPQKRIFGRHFRRIVCLIMLDNKFVPAVAEKNISIDLEGNL